MTAQEAAAKILKEKGFPIGSRQIARIALNKGYVTSSSKNPVFSIATTIEKNIRENRYNSPRLEFIRTTEGRKIGLPDMKAANESKSGQISSDSALKRVTLELPSELVDQIQLAYQANLADSYEETYVLLLKHGLKSYTGEIKKRLLEKLEGL